MNHTTTCLLIAALLAVPGLSKAQKPAKPNAAAVKRVLKAQLAEALVDAPSARYRGEFLSISEDGEMVSLCGEVNSKNRMGGYAGFTRFISVGDGQVIFEHQEGSAFRFVWPVWCSAPEK